MIDKCLKLLTVSAFTGKIRHFENIFTGLLLWRDIMTHSGGYIVQRHLY